MNAKRKIVVIGAIAVVVCLVFLVRVMTKTAQADLKDDAPRPAAVALVKHRPIANAITLTGAFRPYQQVDVHAKVAGYIKHIYVDYGDQVKSGQTLAILEVPELSAQVAGAKAGLKRAQDSVTKAKSDIQSAESIHAAYHSAYSRLKQASEARPGLIAEQELDDSMAKDKDSEAKIDSDKAALSEAESQLAVAQAELERVMALEDYTHVTAPFSGVITKRYADTGTMIQAGTASDTQSMPVVQLAEWSRLRLVVPIPEAAVPSIRLGTVVRVHVIALNRDFEGKVARFADALNDETRTMHTEIDVENPDGTLKDGMYAETKLVLQADNNALAVPIQALVLNSKGATVLIVNDQGRVEQRQVKLGIQGSDEAQVLGGLSENNRVIIGDPSGFHDGERVQAKLQPTITAAEEEGEK